MKIFIEIVGRIGDDEVHAFPRYVFHRLEHIAQHGNVYPLFRQFFRCDRPLQVDPPFFLAEVYRLVAG